MKPISKLLLTCFAVMALALATPLRAESEKRIAFVVGNAAYAAVPLATAANDAGLIAQTLQAAGFDVAGARDLDGEALRAAFRDFLDKAQASGPDTVAFVYLSGYGAQLDGDNYFAPVDAKIASAPDVAVEALRVSDYAKRLAGLPLKASFVVLDAARATPFARSGQPLAGGLALADAEPNMLIAFNAAPGTVAPFESGPYGAYARALAEMIREGGLSPSQVFDGVRLRVSEETKGAQAPWDASRIAAPFVFFERAHDAPPPALASEQISEMQSRPLADLGAHDAYAAAIERDTLQGYEEFLAAYPSDPLANRVRALLAARREALTWQRTCRVNTPNAYWSYLHRYPRGPHLGDARMRLATFAAPEEPPPSFTPILYDVPPPPPPEIIYVDRPVLVLDDPAFGFAPPPRIVFLAPPYLVFPPPPPPVELFVLPAPVFVPVPVWIDPPAYVAPPPENVIFANIHNTTVINNNSTVINSGAPNLPATPAAGLPTAAAIGAGVAGAAIAAKVALPPSVAHKTTLIGASSPGSPGLNPSQPAPGPLPPQSGGLPHGGAMPGVTGKPSPVPGGLPQNIPSAAHALPSGQQLPPVPAGQGAPAGAKPGVAGQPSGPAGQPQGAPAGAHALPSGQQLPPVPAGHGAPAGAKPGVAGQPPSGPAGQPQGAPAGAAHALPSGQQVPPMPGGHAAPAGAKPGVAGQPPSGPAGQPQGAPAGAAHALPSGQQVPPLPGGHAAAAGAKPGAAGKPAPGPGRPGALSQPQAPPGGKTVGQPPPAVPGNKPPANQIPPRNSPAPAESKGPPPIREPHPAQPQVQQPRPPQQTVQQPHPQPQPQVQQPQAQPRPPQQTFQQPRPQPQAQQARPQPQVQQPQAQPRPPQQTSRPQPQTQQARPQPQQHVACGAPGQSPCH
jgi:uncharacterized caspase-like protein